MYIKQSSQCSERSKILIFEITRWLFVHFFYFEIFVVSLYTGQNKVLFLKSECNVKLEVNFCSLHSISKYAISERWGEKVPEVVKHLSVLKTVLGKYSRDVVTWIILSLITPSVSLKVHSNFFQIAVYLMKILKKIDIWMSMDEIWNLRKFESFEIIMSLKNRFPNVELKRKFEMWNIFTRVP